MPSNPTSEKKPAFILPGRKIDHINIIDEQFEDSLQQLSNVDTREIQQVVASQLKIMNAYYTLVLDQARRSFTWALVAAAIGLVFFIGAVGVILLLQLENVAIISVISGAIIEVVSGINFFLYGKTSLQLGEFQSRLDQTQRFLLADSVCERLDGDVQQQARKKLVEVIAG